MSERSPSASRERVAHHEAAHFVAHLAYDLPSYSIRSTRTTMLPARSKANSSIGSKDSQTRR